MKPQSFLGSNVEGFSIIRPFSINLLSENGR